MSARTGSRIKNRAKSKKKKWAETALKDKREGIKRQ